MLGLAQPSLGALLFRNLLSLGNFVSEELEGLNSRLCIFGYTESGGQQQGPDYQ